MSAERVTLDDFNSIPEHAADSFHPVSPGRLGGKQKPAAEPLPFSALDAALANVPSEPEWTWKGFLVPGAISLLAGRPKVGKSTLLFGLISALLRGEPLADLETRATGVLLLSEERHASPR